MSESTDAAPPQRTTEERYGSIEIGGGETIIYDRETPEAWVQSDVVLHLSA